MGWVGSSVAISILQRGLCKELLLNDLQIELAEGEAMDLNHGSSFFPTCKVKAASIAEMKDCTAVIVTAGRGGKAGESRLELLNDNIRIAQAISRELEGFHGLLIILANPVDVLTYFYQRFSGLPTHRVIGTGTMLDTARLRESVGRRIQVDPRSIHAQVIGEHGDSEVVLWSTATIGGNRLRDWEHWDVGIEKEIAEEVRTAAYEIIKRKGATNHAIGLVTATLLKWLLRGEKRVINLSSVQSGVLGLSDLAISLPTMLSEKGIEHVFEPEMDPVEKRGLENSVDVIQKAIQNTQYY